MELGRTLVVVGLGIVVLGLVLHFAPQVPLLGKLPGDIRIERPGWRLYLPLTTSLLLSVGLTALLFLLSKLR